MRDVFSMFLMLVGALTVGVVIFLLFMLWWENWGRYWFKFHKHTYQVNHIWRIDSKERGCEQWDICFKCEKCGKDKHITFWNDGIKLEVKDGEQNG